jgi:hypothetical protein
LARRRPRAHRHHSGKRRVNRHGGDDLARSAQLFDIGFRQIHQPQNLLALVELGFRIDRLRLRDAQLAFGHCARFDQQLRAVQPVRGERLIGNRGEVLALRFDEVRRPQPRDRLSCLDRLVGGDEHRLDHPIGRGRDHAQLLRRNDDRAGKCQLDVASFLACSGGRNSSSPDFVLVERECDGIFNGMGDKSGKRDKRRSGEQERREAGRCLSAQACADFCRKGLRRKRHSCVRLVG